MRSLQAQTANPGQFVLELEYRTDSARRHEAMVFDLLDEYRWNKVTREFFACSPRVAYLKLRDYFEREPDWIRPELMVPPKQ